VLTFTVAPFIILSFIDSITVWARVYFYGAVGIIGSMGLFASPAKRYLIRRLKERNKIRDPREAAEPDWVEAPTLGLPNDPARDIDEAVREIRQEIDMRRRRGSKVSMPTEQELRTAVEQKLGRKL
jgi:lysophospholipid acyltransferase